MCAQKDSSAVSNETMIALTKGIVETLVYILDPANKRDVSEVLKKNLRLSKDEDVEASYRVSRLQMPNIDVAPNLEAWRTVKRMVGESECQSRRSRPGPSDRDRPGANLESSGFMAEMRKKLPRITPQRDDFPTVVYSRKGTKNAKKNKITNSKLEIRNKPK